MTDYGTLKLSNGHLAVRNGRLVKGCLTAKPTVNFCPLCNGASFLFSVETSGIVVGVVDSCEILQAGFNSEMFKVLPYVLPNCTQMVFFQGYTQRAGYPSGIKIAQDGLAQGSLAGDSDDALFQYPAWYDGDWEDGPRCTWYSCDWWGSGNYPPYPLGQYYQYIEEDDCTGAYYNWAFEGLSFDLSVFDEHVKLRGYYKTRRAFAGVSGEYVFFYATIDRTPGDTGPFEFTNEKEGGIMYGGTATVTLVGDPIIDTGLAQSNWSGDEPIFQGDIH